MADAAEGNAAQIAYWNDKAAQNWTAAQEKLDAVFSPLTQAALAAAAPRPGERVIDIGCGCGATTLELARRIGPGGHVLGVDVSAPMAARATERIAAAGLDNAAIRVEDASTHAFPPGEADLLFSRFGVMFFADPVAAFANLHRAMRPGGRLLFACWRPLRENSWFTVPLDAALPLLPPPPPPEPNAPGPFAFADATRVHAILREAGWRDIAAQPHDAPMPIAGPGEVAEAIDFIGRVGALARLLIDVDDGLRARVLEAVAAAMRAHDGPGGLAFGAAIWLVSARA